MKKLNLGCGKNILKGFVNVDFRKAKGVDVIHNLEKFPYPFEESSIDYVVMDNVLEHLDDTTKIMEELHRICKPHAIIRIIVPHYSSFMAWGHLTHKKAFGIGTFNNFKPSSWEKYSKVNFEVKKNKLIYLDSRQKIFHRIINRVMNKIINWNYYLSERFLCYYLGGFDHIDFELKVIK